MSDLYKILGISKNADKKEIRNVFLDLCKTKHPDKGGDEEEFKKIKSAYDTLYDDEKRQIYDMTGRTDDQPHPEQGSGGMPMGGFPFPFPFGGMGGFGAGGIHVDVGNIFDAMFHGQRGAGGQEKKQGKRPKGPNKCQEIPISLEDFYNGKKIKFNIGRQSFCSECEGEGCLNWKTCSECRGSGVRESMVQIGPGMIAKNRGPCMPCKTEGRIRGTNCEKCEGKGLVNSPKELEVNINPGANVGDILTFENMCSDQKEFERPGDFQIRLMQADEELDITRQGKNLHTSFTLKLSESLLGCKRKIEDHPGYKEGLEIDIPQGVQNGEVVKIESKGMPVGNGKGFGDLLVTISVNATEGEKKILEENKEILSKLFWNFA